MKLVKENLGHHILAISILEDKFSELGFFYENGIFQKYINGKKRSKNKTFAIKIYMGRFDLNRKIFLNDAVADRGILIVLSVSHSNKQKHFYTDFELCEQKIPLFGSDMDTVLKEIDGAFRNMKKHCKNTKISFCKTCCMSYMIDDQSPNHICQYG